MPGVESFDPSCLSQTQIPQYMKLELRMRNRLAHDGEFHLLWGNHYALIDVSFIDIEPESFALVMA